MGRRTDRIRPPAVAGRFYPGTPDRLAATVDALLDAVAVPDTEPLAAAYIVPHAAYQFSGPTAARVYARLRRHAGTVTRVVLLGPAHFVALTGLAAPQSSVWATPLGNLPVEQGHDLVTDDAPHAGEHSLEVQLPLLQRALARPVPVLPVVVGDAGADQLAAHLATTVDPGTVVLCSTDLSHDLDRAAATARDTRTADAVTALAPERIGPADACGWHALRGLLAWARDAALRPAVLHLATSADTAGEPTRVVGYGAFAMHGPIARAGAQRR